MKRLNSAAQKAAAAASLRRAEAATLLRARLMGEAFTGPPGWNETTGPLFLQSDDEGM